MSKLTLKDIKTDVQPSVTVQSYSPKQKIDGVQMVDNPIFSGEDGTFEELARFDDGMMLKFPDFQIKQINRSIVLPGAIKAWHLHYNQEDIWYVPPQDFILLGLWDVREKSPTSGISQKIVMGAGRARLVYIPRGVAHGAANVSHKESTLIYFVNQCFDAENPDEQRLQWDLLGNDFWTAEKG